jgi:hypothetical protein
MTDDQSFWTARGTLRVPPDEGATGEEMERDVLVAYMPDGGDMEEVSGVRFGAKLPGQEAQVYAETPNRTRQSMEPMVTSQPAQRGTTGFAGGSTGSTSTTPLPLLLLFNHPHPPPTSTYRHPPSSPPALSPRDVPTKPGNSSSSTDRSAESAESARYALVLGSHLLGSAQRHAEKAFWGVLMPSLSELVGWGEALQGALVSYVSIDYPTSIDETLILDMHTSVQSYLSLFPSSNVGSGAGVCNDLLEGPAQGHQPRAHLYSDETVYTLRLPAPVWDHMEGDDTGRVSGAVEIGPTVRPEFVKKRGALPAWESGVAIGGDWGRDVGRDVRGLWV